MKSIRIKWATALVAIATASLPALAETLTEGDPAPGLQVSKWVQGDPVQQFETGKAYIVEFWATWSAPSRESIPQLNDFHNKFKDKGLVVIGIDMGETPEKVASFVKQMGNKMSYRVGMDTPDTEDPARGKTELKWMVAAAIKTIPTVFIVDKKGTIVFVGQPMELDDTVIQKILDGTFDTKQAVLLHKKVIEMQENLRKVGAEFDKNVQQKDWDKAMSTLDQIEKLMPASRKPAVGFMRVKILLNKGDGKGASQLATQLSEEFKDDAVLLNALAWELATEPGVTERDLPLAEKLASKANDLTEGKNAQILDTLARIVFMEGKKDKAIEYESKAVPLAEGKVKEMLQSNLDSFKAGKLPPVE